MAAVLGANHHGKGRVRLAKVIRKGERHVMLQFNVTILLEGPMTPAFVHGDNSIIIPTDTQKNTVYVVAKRNNFESAEEFALILARHFLDTYPQLVTRARIEVKAEVWQRLTAPDSHGRDREHNHAFQKLGPHWTYARSDGVRDAAGRPSIKLWGGVKQLTVLKTTQSSFVDFHKDEYTTLGPATDRFVGTAIDAEWDYESSVASARVDFVALRDVILDRLVKTFIGPADKGVHSVSVQADLYNMGAAVLAAAPLVRSITMYMPNIHNIPFDLSRFGIVNADHTGQPDILYPIDEPHGMIQGTVERPGASKL